MIKGFKKPLIPFFAMAAALAVPAQASDKVLSDANGVSIQAYNMDHDTALKTIKAFNDTDHPEYGTGQYYLARMKYLGDAFYTQIKADGLSDEEAQNLSKYFAQMYTATPVQGPSSERIFKAFNENQLHPLAGTGPTAQNFTYNIPSENIGYCAVVTAGNSYSGYQWASDFTRIIEMRKDLPPSYGRYFNEFSTFHEFAHCFGADETLADYIASLQLLNKYKNQPDNIQEFLTTLSGIRNLGSLNDTDPIYAFSGTAILSAIDRYKVSPNEYNSESKIYRVITQRKFPTFKEIQELSDKTFMTSLFNMQAKLQINMCLTYQDEKLVQTLGCKPAV